MISMQFSSTIFNFAVLKLEIIGFLFSANSLSIYFPQAMYNSSSFNSTGLLSLLSRAIFSLIFSRELSLVNLVSGFFVVLIFSCSRFIFCTAPLSMINFALSLFNDSEEEVSFFALGERAFAGSLFCLGKAMGEIVLKETGFTLSI